MVNTEIGEEKKKIFEDIKSFSIKKILSDESKNDTGLMIFTRNQNVGLEFDSEKGGHVIYLDILMQLIYDDYVSPDVEDLSIGHFMQTQKDNENENIFMILCDYIPAITYQEGPLTRSQFDAIRKYAMEILESDYMKKGRLLGVCIKDSVVTSEEELDAVLEEIEKEITELPVPNQNILSCEELESDKILPSDIIDNLDRIDPKQIVEAKRAVHEDMESEIEK